LSYWQLATGYWRLAVFAQSPQGMQRKKFSGDWQTGDWQTGGWQLPTHNR